MPFYQLCICWGCMEPHYCEEERPCDKCGEPLKDIRTYSLMDYAREECRKIEAAQAARTQAIKNLHVPLTAASALFSLGRRA